MGIIISMMFITLLSLMFLVNSLLLINFNAIICSSQHQHLEALCFEARKSSLAAAYINLVNRNPMHCIIFFVVLMTLNPIYYEGIIILNYYSIMNPVGLRTLIPQCSSIISYKILITFNLLTNYMISLNFSQLAIMFNHGILILIPIGSNSINSNSISIY